MSFICDGLELFIVTVLGQGFQKLEHKQATTPYACRHDRLSVGGPQPRMCVFSYVPVTLILTG